MAIIKIANQRPGKAYALKAVLDYIKNPSKTNDGLLVSAKDCLLECDYEQMLATKLGFHQDKGRQYVHIIQSFATTDELSNEDAHEIGMRMLENFQGYQGVVATHADKKHLHNHIVLNSVNFENGQKWQYSKADLMDLRKFSDKLCDEFGLSVITPDRTKKSNSNFKSKSTSWKYLLAQDIANSLEKSFSRDDFLHKLDDLGITADFGTKNIMFRVNADCANRYGLKKEVSCQNYKLSAFGDFSFDNINKHLDANEMLCDIGFNDIQIRQNALLSVGKMLFPETPRKLEEDYFAGIDFDGLTYEEILAALAKLASLKYFAEFAQKQREECENTYNQFLSNMDELYDEVLEKHKKMNSYTPSYYQHDDLEYDMEL